jgi:hypothetical protein
MPNERGCTVQSDGIDYIVEKYPQYNPGPEFFQARSNKLGAAGVSYSRSFLEGELRTWLRDVLHKDVSESSRIIVCVRQNAMQR